MTDENDYDRFHATVNHPDWPESRCFRSSALEKTSDLEFASMTMADAEELCTISGDDDYSLCHIRYINELRRRLQHRCEVEL